MRKAPTYMRIENGTTEKTLMGKRGENSRTKNETWKGRIETVLSEDGEFVVLLGTKEGHAAVIARGNVGDDPIFGRNFIAGDGKVRQVSDLGEITEAEPITFTVTNPETLPEGVTL